MQNQAKKYKLVFNQSHLQSHLQAGQGERRTQQKQEMEMQNQTKKYKLVFNHSHRGKGERRTQQRQEKEMQNQAQKYKWVFNHSHQHGHPHHGEGGRRTQQKQNQTKNQKQEQKQNQKEMEMQNQTKKYKEMQKPANHEEASSESSWNRVALEANLQCEKRITYVLAVAESGCSHPIWITELLVTVSESLNLCMSEQ